MVETKDIIADFSSSEVKRFELIVSLLVLLEERFTVMAAMACFI